MKKLLVFLILCFIYNSLLLDAQQAGAAGCTGSCYVVRSGNDCSRWKKINLCCWKIIPAGDCYECIGGLSCTCCRARSTYTPVVDPEAVTYGDTLPDAHLEWWGETFRLEIDVSGLAAGPYKVIAFSTLVPAVVRTDLADFAIANIFRPDAARYAKEFPGGCHD